MLSSPDPAIDPEQGHAEATGDSGPGFRASSTTAVPRCTPAKAGGRLGNRLGSTILACLRGRRRHPAGLSPGMLSGGAVGVLCAKVGQIRTRVHRLSGHPPDQFVRLELASVAIEVVSQPAM